MTRRPDPVRWTYYAFGGVLDRRYQEWVLHDLTCSTRWLRQAARAALQVAPLAALLFLVLGFSWITWAGIAGGLLMALIYSLAYIDQSAEHRLIKHGFPPGTLQRVLHERDMAKDPDRLRRYNETYRNNGVQV